MIKFRQFYRFSLLKELFDTNAKMNKPFFLLNSGQIDVLSTPVDFYVELNRGIKQSQKRILFNSLYLGGGNMEKYLIERLSLHAQKFSQIKISILFDYYRGTRIDMKVPENSKSLLNYIRKTNITNHNIELAFLRHPFLPQPFDLFKEGSFREIFNVHHMKWYVFDDKVIISGANLQQNYFTDRQDRYIVINEAPELADYLHDAQSSLVQHSFQINEIGQLLVEANQAPPYKKRKYFKEFLQTWKMFEFSHQHDVYIYHFQGSQLSDFFESQQKTTEEEPNSKKTEEDDIDPDTLKNLVKKDENVSLMIQQTKEKAAQVQRILRDSFSEGDVQNILSRLEKQVPDYDKSRTQSGEQVFLFVTMSVPFLQTNHDQEMMKALMNYMDKNPQTPMVMTSGYFNLDNRFRSWLQGLKNQVQIICASPNANGFHKAGKHKKYIPYFYRYFLIQLLKKCGSNVSKKHQYNIAFNEYDRRGWTYHAKGIWIPIGDEDMLTVIGSSNYSERSLHRDTEVQFYIYSKCPDLNQELTKEYQDLLEHSKRVTLEDLQQDKEVKVGLKIKIWANIFRSLL